MDGSDTLSLYFLDNQSIVNSHYPWGYELGIKPYNSICVKTLIVIFCYSPFLRNGRNSNLTPLKTLLQARCTATLPLGGRIRVEALNAVTKDISTLPVVAVRVVLESSVVNRLYSVNNMSKYVFVENWGNLLFCCILLAVLTAIDSNMTT